MKETRRYSHILPLRAVLAVGLLFLMLCACVPTYNAQAQDTKEETIVFDPCLLPKGLRKPGIGTNCDDTPGSTQTQRSNPPISAPVTMPKQIGECGDDGFLLFLTPLLTTFETQLSDGSQRFLVDKEAFEEGITLKMQREGITQEQLCNDMKEKKNKLENDPTYDYYDLRSELMACEASCGQILSAFGAVYIGISAQSIKGLVRFNFNDTQLKGSFKGDGTHGNMMVYNQSQLQQVYDEWASSGGKKRIGLDARASLPGTIDANELVSEARCTAVANWFASKGVPRNMIDRKWLGNYGPLIDKNVAAFYNLQDMYAAYISNSAKQTYTGVAGIQIPYFDGINQSVAIFLYDE